MSVAHFINPLGFSHVQHLQAESIYNWDLYFILILCEWVYF